MGQADERLKKEEDDNDCAEYGVSAANTRIKLSRIGG